MNKVWLTGRTTRNIELRYTNSNIAVTQFTLAVNRDFKNADGNYDSDFINCVAFKKTAELISQYVEKGDRLGIVGRIQIRDYQDKDNNKRYATEVIVDSIEFWEQKKKETENQTQSTTSNSKSNSEILKDVMQDKDPFAEFGEQVTIDDNFLE